MYSCTYMYSDACSALVVALYKVLSMCVSPYVSPK